MTATPLLAHDSPGAIIAYRDGRAIDVTRFLEEALALAQRLPPTRHVFNACTDRYGFAVGFAACLISERVSLLPSTHAPEVIRRLEAFAPDVLCLTDRADCDIALPRWRLRAAPPRRVPVNEAALEVPRIADERLAAIVFTSGSTGTPLPHRKTWWRLAQCVRHAADRLDLAAQRWTLVGTVPAQHMYGFESTVLLALVGGHAFAAERPFYPADIAATLEAAPRPRALITTPLHLRTLLAAGLALPALDLIVSATAPLSAELATEAEQRFGARLIEIYGSTETGQIASRRTASEAAFRLWPDVRLRVEGDVACAEGGHIEQTTTLCDVIEPRGADEFLLEGRTADLVNVAGKRSSLGYLNAQLLAIPGVIDGTFFWPDLKPSSVTEVTRLAAAVVAPELSAATLIERLRERIDPAFLPRPLLLVDELPRNATGKLPRRALELLIERGRGRAAGR